MKLSIIVAASENGVIGRAGALPWRLPSDLRRFKRLTMGHGLIVGRRTFESIGRALPGRRMVVLTTQRAWHAADVRAARTLDEALELAGGDEVFVGGGGQVYRQTLERADRMYLTTVKQHVEGDTFFPPFDPADWTTVSREDFVEPANGLEYTFAIHDRRPTVS